MKMRTFVSAIVLVVAAAINATAQKTEITISLNEQFFDALIDAIYQNSPPPQIPLLSKAGNGRNEGMTSSFASKPDCGVVTLLRENKSMRTAVRFRDGKIYAPVAFTGSYNPPLVGCVDFAGYAETNIDLLFDRDGQKLVGRIKVLNVDINGTAGIGGALI